MIRRNSVFAESRYVAAQGRVLGRDGRIEVEFDPDGAIWLGGTANGPSRGFDRTRAVSGSGSRPSAERLPNKRIDTDKPAG